MRLKRKLSEMSEEKSEENVGTMENVVEKKKEQGIASFFTKKTTTTRKKRKTNELNLIKLPSGNVFDVMKDKVPEQVTHEFAQALVDRIKELTSTMKKTSNKKTSSPPTISKPSKTVRKGRVKRVKRVKHIVSIINVIVEILYILERCESYCQS